MKSHTSAGKTTRRTTDGPSHRSPAGENAAAFAPPAYGIDFVDRDLKANAGPLLQGKLPTQFQSEPPAPKNDTGLPDGLKSGIESLSGISLDNVSVHYNSSRPAQFNALACAQGSDIHVAPGQARHLPHEAWHLVQQAQARVKPTMQMKDGVPVNDDAGLEHEADVMGVKALANAAQLHVHRGGGVRSRPPDDSGTTPVQGSRTAGSSGVGGARAPVQRLIGFEVEYRVPTFTKADTEVNFKGGRLKNGEEREPSAAVRAFLFGGLPYETKLGGSAKPGENSFRITSDHHGAISREPIREALAEMGKLEPADSTDPDATSNLEYVTSPVDELAKGSDRVLETMIDSVVEHARSTFELASQSDASRLPSPAAQAATGTPKNDIEDWLSAEDFKQLEPTIKAFRSNILDTFYIQTTVGVLPSAIGMLFASARTEGLHRTDDAAAQVFEAVAAAFKNVGVGVSGHDYIEELKSNEQNEILKSVGGMIRLLVMYLIGEALSQTSAFPGGTIKNAVPFLVKIDPSQIAASGPARMNVFDPVPDSFVTTLAQLLGQQKQIKVEYWIEELGYEARQREKEDRVTVGSIENLARMFFQGEKPASTNAQTGSRLKYLDTMKEIASDTKRQKGIPLEYRSVKAQPSAAGLKAELLKLVAQAREINLRKVSKERKLQIEGQVKK